MSFILRLSCSDKPGIVAAVATAMSNHQCNIDDSAQFHDVLSGQFFMRVAFTPLVAGCQESFAERFTEIAKQFDMEWQLCDVSSPLKTLIMVSQHDHCLHDLLYRWKTGALPIDITAIVSNHEVTKVLSEGHNLPFYHLPITKENKAAQEEILRNIMIETDTELVVLARYMQIMSEDFCNDFPGRVINIHHSFLPGFKGAKPYHQAYERGVKIIGATAHFATSDLDEGPIITQNISNVDHRDTPEKMKALGQDIERRTLADAINMYSERRIFVHGRRTIIL